MNQGRDGKPTARGEVLCYCPKMKSIRLARLAQASCWRDRKRSMFALFDERVEKHETSAIRSRECRLRPALVVGNAERRSEFRKIWDVTIF